MTTRRWRQPLTACLALGLWLGTGDAQARGPVCSEADSTAADAAIGTLAARKDAWPALHAVFKRYRHCDDGGVAEGFSETIVSQLARDWASVATAARLAARDPAFGAFVVAHIDSTADTDQLAAIQKAAKSRCPAGLCAFCARVRAAAARALADS